MEHLSTGCKTIDDLMFGGFPIPAVSGIVSEPNIGKSQLVAQTALANNSGVIIETEQKGYDFSYYEKRFGVEENKVQVINILELTELLKFCGINAQLSLSKGGKIKTTLELMDNFQLQQILGKHKPKMFAIDSFSMPLKSYLEQKAENLPVRATIENILFGRLQEVARDYNCAVVLTHHEGGPDPLNPWKKADAYGGPIVLYNTGYLLHLYDSVADLRKKYGETVKRIRRERWIFKLASEQVPVDLKEDYGYTEVEEKMTRGKEQSVGRER